MKITSIEPVDYKKLYKNGPDYLRKVVGRDTADYYLNKSNIKSVIPFIPKFIQTVKQEIRRGSVEEIIENLKNGALVGVEVNSRILNNKLGFSLHYVLLYDFDREHIFFHDPGLPPIKGRKISLKDFEKAFNFPGSNGGITIFRK